MSEYKIGGDEFTHFLDSINIHVKLTPNTLNLRSIQSVAVASSVSIAFSLHRVAISNSFQAVANIY
jgi:hypothetical protein